MATLGRRTAELHIALAGARGDPERLITLFCLARALREVRDELSSRPERVGIALEGLLRLVEASTATATMP
jgi:predicted trehalose synthase